MIKPTTTSTRRPATPALKRYNKRKAAEAKAASVMKNRAMTAEPKPMPKNDPKEQFAAAVELLNRLIRDPEVGKQFDPNLRTNTRMVYTKGVTLWMLILQRIGNGLSLEHTVSHILNFDRDLLPDNKRVREGTLSENSSGYHKARKELSLRSIHQFSAAVCDYLGRSSRPILGLQRVFIIDGTTITLKPTPELRRAFPPATNQHGESVWPVAMLMVAAELQSGCALLPQINPMYGPNNSSEAQQARRIVKQLPPGSIVMADSGFGIFSVAFHARRAGHDIHFRMTTSRFKSLRKKAVLVDEGTHHKSYSVCWTPSVKDRSSNPDLPDDAVIDVIIHEVKLDNGKKLNLVTTLDINATSAAELYSRRYDVEFDIRDLKVTMDAENILATSVLMVKKELMTSVVAYNLIMQFRRQAAKLARVEPRRLSFKGVWLSFRDHLLLQDPKTREEWQDLYAQALISASNRKLPNRSKPRSSPRRAHPRRPKSTKFMKSERAQKTNTNDDPPPPLVPK